VLGIIPLLIVAGTVEGFVSPSNFPSVWKYVLAVGLFGVLILFVMRKTTGSSAAGPAPLAETVPNV
jgi:hypothetical protein